MKKSFEIIMLFFIPLILFCEHPEKFIRDQATDPKGIHFGIKITTPVDNEFFSTEFAIQIDPTYISTQFNLKELKIYINDSLIASSTKVPFSQTIYSEDFKNGQYTISCTAYSKHGQEVEEKVQIAIGSDNIFLNSIQKESDSIILQWDYEIDPFFSEYQIFRSTNYTMTDASLIASISDASIDTLIIPMPSSESHYQIVVKNNLGHIHTSNIQGILCFDKIALVNETESARDVEIGPDGTIFLANDDNGLIAYEFNGEIFTKTAHIDNGGTAFNIVISNTGTIFLANGEDGLRAYTYNGSSFINTGHIDINENDSYAYDVLIGSDDIIFLSTPRGLYAYEYDGSSFTSKGHIAFEYITILCIGNNGTIFASKYKEESGLHALIFNDSCFTEIANYSNTNGSSCDNRHNDAFANLDGTIFVGGCGGLYAFSFDGSSFNNLTHIDKSNDCSIQAVRVNSDGIIFTVNGQDGLRAYTYNGSIFTNIAHRNDLGYALDLEIAQDGTIFLADSEYGLYAYKFIK